MGWRVRASTSWASSSPRSLRMSTSVLRAGLWPRGRLVCQTLCHAALLSGKLPLWMGVPGAGHLIHLMACRGYTRVNTDMASDVPIRPDGGVLSSTHPPGWRSTLLHPSALIRVYLRQSTASHLVLDAETKTCSGFGPPVHRHRLAQHHVSHVAEPGISLAHEIPFQRVPAPLGRGEQPGAQVPRSAIHCWENWARRTQAVQTGPLRLARHR